MYAKLTSLDRVWGEHRALSYIQIRYPIYLPEESCINNNCNFYWYFFKDSFPHHVTTVLYQKCWSRLIFLPSSYWTEILTSGIVFLSLLFFLLMMDISRYILHFLVSKFSFSRGYLPSGLRWLACKKNQKFGTTEFVTASSCWNNSLQTLNPKFNQHRQLKTENTAEISFWMRFKRVFQVFEVHRTSKR